MAKKRPDDLPIIQKAYNTAMYLIPAVERMPRVHRFTLGDRIANAVYDFLELLTVARFTRDKLQMLKEANLLLERLRLLLRLAKDLKGDVHDGSARRLHPSGAAKRGLMGAGW